MKKTTKKFWAATFTLTGTIIGAGILGLPYVFAQAGFFSGLFWLIFLGIIMTLTFLYLGEVTLRTKEKHQLPGLAEKYLGRKGKVAMFLAMVFGIYSSLLAYLVGEGESLSRLFFGTGDYAFYLTIGFWLVLTLLLREGLKGLKKVETYGVLAIIIIIVGIFINFLPNVSVQNLAHVNNAGFFIPLGVVMFALLGFTTIPELKMELTKKKKLMKKAILIGVLLPIIIYTLFTFTFVGVLGQEVEKIATLSFGSAITILGIFTMLTSYLVLSFSLKDMYRLDIGLSKTKTSLLTSLLPLLLFVFVFFFGLNDFITIVGIGGVVSGGLIGITTLFMNYNAKKMGNRKPEYSVRINKTIIAVISLIFIAGVLVELLL